MLRERRRRRQEAEVNPMDGVANLADAMLVLAVGIMLALILNWNVDISAVRGQADPETEEAHWGRIVQMSELIARLGPIFGLLGTLIPLGPGIIALGQGDTFTLSESLLTAFDTTVAGLLAAALASVISVVRRRWYRRYGSDLETVAECLLETIRMNTEDLKMNNE